MYLDDAWVIIENSVILENSAGGLYDGVSGGGGGVYSTNSDLYVSESRVEANAVSDNNAAGGGFYVEGAGYELKISDDSEVVGNEGAYKGGGIFADEVSVFVDGSLIEDNHVTVNAYSFGGGIYSLDGSVELLNGSALANNMAYESGSGVLVYEGSLTADNVTFLDNDGADTGGAIYSYLSGVNLNLVELTGNNVDESGGAIYSYSSDLVMTDSTASANSAGTVGGALYLREAQHEIDENRTYSNTSVIKRSTLDANVAPFAAAIMAAGQAITATTSLENVTVSGNFGADAIRVSGFTPLDASSTTIADNNGVGVNLASGMAAYFESVLLSGNGARDCDGGIVPTSLGGNGDSDYTCAFSDPTDLPGAMGSLFTLADNGGPTKTQALSPGHSAVDAGSCASTLSTDQRGMARVNGASCDMGAYELH